MNQEDLVKEITKIEKKFIRDGRESLVRELRNLSNEQRRDRLKAQAILMQEIIDSKAKAERELELKLPVNSLREAISTVKEHNSLFREQTDAAKRLSRFIHLLIEESGKV